MTDIDALRAKLKLREGKPGFAANVSALKITIGLLEGETFAFRDIASGQFVTTEYALANPDTTREVEI